MGVLNVDESSERSSSSNLGGSGLRSEELVQRVQKIISQAILSVTDSSLVQSNLPLKIDLNEMPADTDMEMPFQNELEEAVDWSGLPKDALVQIAENHLLSLDDFTAFSLVCRSWHCAAAACNLVKLREKWIHRQMPWLMLTDGNTDVDEKGYSQSVFVLPRVLNDVEEYDDDAECMSEARSGREELYTRRVLNLRRRNSYNIECPELYGRVCWGSAYGWIVTAGGDGKMFMFNPLTKARVSLPSFGTFCKRWDNEDEIRRNYFVTRAVVLKVGADDAQSCGENVENLRVVAFYSDDNVAIAKPGSRRWVEIEGGPRIYSPLRDVLYDSNIGLIFVDSVGGLLSCNIPEDEESPFLKWIQPPVDNMIEHGEDYMGAYIVKCGEHLLMILRIVEYERDADDPTGASYPEPFEIDTYRTSLFEVYMYNFKSKLWEPVSDLQYVALFVGNNATMWVDARTAGCEGNHIYFTDDVRRKYRDTKDMLGGHDCGDYWHQGRGIQAKHRPLYEGNNKRSCYCCPL